MNRNEFASLTDTVFRIFDNEMQHAAGPTTLQKFHDAYVARHPYTKSHGDLDRILQTHKLWVAPPSGIHALPDYSPTFVNASPNTNVAPSSTVNVSWRSRPW